MIKVCPHCGKEIAEGSLIFKPSRSDIQRFWKHVHKTDNGCWMCNLVPSEKYARIMFDGKLVLAHVFSWKVHNGPIPVGMKVCHKCDVPRCVRPDHLFLGTQSENMKDMVSKKRNNPVNGERNHCSKLTVNDVLFIRNAVSSGYANISDLAAKFNTSFQAIYHLVRGQTWKHVGGPLINLKSVRHLSLLEVGQIRNLAQQGEKQLDIAARFGIHQGVVSNIVRGVRHKPPQSL